MAASNQPRLSAARAKQVLIWTVVLASMGWTAYNWSGLDRVRHRLGDAAIIAVLLILCEVSFVIGAALVAVGLGREAFRGTGHNPLRWIAALLQVRSQFKVLAACVSNNKLFRFGFYLNWMGAFGTGLVLLIGIIIVLPVTAWGIAILPLLDIVATFGWRLPIETKMRTLEDA